MLDGILQGALITLQAKSLLLLLGGVGTGVVFGAIPGLTSGIAIAILLPFTFYMNIHNSLALLAGVYVGGTYGGSISAILFGTPGAPESGVTVLDGYPMAQQGYPNRALDTALYSSSLSNVLSSLSMLFLSMAIAALALMIGSTEFFSIVLFSLVLIATVGVGGSSWYKGLSAVLLGLLCSFVGSDPVSAIPRLNFGSLALSSGLPLIPLLVGLFVGAEIIQQAGAKKDHTELSIKFGGSEDRMRWPQIKAMLPYVFSGAAIGTVIGALPGLNAAVSAMLNYGFAKRISKTPERFGKGELRGIAAAEAGNNGTVGPTLCPLLTLGIPGSGTAALFLGALLIQGVTPGPTIFETAPVVVYSLFWAIFLSSVIMIVVGKVVIYFAKYIPLIPTQVINPCIILFCASGAFAIDGAISDVFILIFFITLGYFMKLGRFPVIPLLIGYLLGGLLETNLRRTLLISGNDYSVFFTSSISLTFLVATAVLLAWVVGSALARKRHRHAPA